MRELLLTLQLITLSTSSITIGSPRGDCITSRTSSPSGVTNPSQFSNQLTVTGYQLTETVIVYNRRMSAETTHDIRHRYACVQNPGGR